jgi:hypothetical protein
MTWRVWNSLGLRDCYILKWVKDQTRFVARIQSDSHETALGLELGAAGCNFSVWRLD